MREVNIHMAELEAGHPGDPGFFFYCECARIGCSSQIEGIPLDKFRHVISTPNRYIVVPGHETEETDSLVEANGEYLIIDRAESG